MRVELELAVAAPGLVATFHSNLCDKGNRSTFTQMMRMLTLRTNIQYLSPKEHVEQSAWTRSAPSRCLRSR